jgi:hypothetical protein
LFRAILGAKQITKGYIMWIFYYANTEKVDSIFNEIIGVQPAERIIERNNTSKSGISAALDANVKLKGLFGFGANIKAQDGQMIFESTKEKYDKTDNKEKANKIIDNLNLLEITKITPDNISTICFNYNSLIQLSGHFYPLLEGDSYARRIAEYNKLNVLTWESMYNSKKIQMFTSKKYIKGNSPIHPALRNKGGTLFFDILGNIQEDKDEMMTISPVLIGTDIKKK